VKCNAPTTPQGGTNGAASPKGAAAVPRLQREWLARARGRRVKVRLLDGTLLAGTLVDSDQYCLALALSVDAEPALLFKHGISALLRHNGGDH
jgi:sRNA-binding regulator protein Hfq